MYRNSVTYQKITILKLYNEVGGWDVLGLLIFAVADEDDSIQNLAWIFLQTWKDRALRLFTRPSTRAIEKAVAYYNVIDPSILKMTSSVKSYGLK
jgi:hypothetical protein